MAQEEDGTAVTVVTPSASARVDVQGEACLVVFYGQHIGRRYFLRQPELTVGRSESAAIQIDQESVSRQHATLRTDAMGCRVSDLGSTNGTFVNDRRVTECEMHDGDLLRVGQTIFKYLSGSNVESKYHEEIYRLTTIDGLTQAYNKRYFLETFERELNRAQRYRRCLALAMFDIDHFKQINDTHGHLAGDCVLRELAAIIAQNIRRQDIFSRFGGEEFALVLPEIDTQGAVPACEKLRALVEETPFVFGDERIAVTISVGIVATAREGERMTATELIARADERLYAAKDGGRNQVAF